MMAGVRHKKIAVDQESATFAGACRFLGATPRCRLLVCALLLTQGFKQAGFPSCPVGESATLGNSHPSSTKAGRWQTRKVKS
jgi:hypothetical protein